LFSANPHIFSLLLCIFVACNRTVGAVVQEIIAELEDSLMVLNALLGNRYNAPFLATIQLWIGRITTCVERLELWMHVQSLWTYMEAVFSGAESWLRVVSFCVDHSHHTDVALHISFC